MINKQKSKRAGVHAIINGLFKYCKTFQCSVWCMAVLICSPSPANTAEFIHAPNRPPVLQPALQPNLLNHKAHAGHQHGGHDGRSGYYNLTKSKYEKLSGLGVINRKAGDISVCIQPLGYYTDNAFASALQEIVWTTNLAPKVASVVQEAFEGWMALLEGQSDWHTPQLAIQFTLESQEERIVGDVDFNGSIITLTDTACQPENHDFIVVVNFNIERSYASIGENDGVVRRITHLAGDFMSNTDNYVPAVPFPTYTSSAFRLTAHELGHLLGLADTYSEPGYQQPIGQPAAIMNNLWALNNFTDDDLIGIRQLWRYISDANSDYCGALQNSGLALENNNNNVFCLPANFGIRSASTETTTSLMSNIADYRIVPSDRAGYVLLKTAASEGTQCLGVSTRRHPFFDKFRNPVVVQACDETPNPYWYFESFNNYFQIKNLATEGLCATTGGLITRMRAACETDTALWEIWKKRKFSADDSIDLEGLLN